MQSFLRTIFFAGFFCVLFSKIGAVNAGSAIDDAARFGVRNADEAPALLALIAGYLTENPFIFIIILVALIGLGYSFAKSRA